MTKTEQELLDAARKNPHGVVSFSSGFVTSRKNGSYGHRKTGAARKLVALGLLKFEETHKSVTHLSHGFGADHGFERVYSLTEKGRTL